jgi:hypothetical protein
VVSLLYKNVNGREYETEHSEQVLIGIIKLADFTGFYQILHDYQAAA